MNMIMNFSQDTVKKIQDRGSKRLPPLLQELPEKINADCFS